MKSGFAMATVLASTIAGPLFAPWLAGTADAQEAEGPPAVYELSAVDCGELDTEAGLRPLRPSHIAGEDLDILCKVTVGLPAKTKGLPKAHTVKLSVMRGQKVAFEQVRDARVPSAGSRVLLFVIPAEKLPTDPGKVVLRVELSKPANKPGFRELGYELVSED